MGQEKTVQKASSNLFDVAVKDLYRQPGSSNFKQLSIKTPEELSTAMVSVPQGTDLEMDISLESVHEGIFAHGTVKTKSIQECSRCLEKSTVDISTGFGELFYYPENVPTEEENDEELDIYEVLDEHINLEQIVRNEVVSQFPFNPICPEGCEEIAVSYLKTEEEHQKPEFDPRWAALAQIKEEGK